MEQTEQKQTIWILAAAGIFLCVIIGAALILYRPSVKDPEITSVKLNTTYMNPVSPTPSVEPNAGESMNAAASNDANLPPASANVAEIDLTTATPSVSPKEDITIVSDKPESAAAPAEAKSAAAVTKPVTTVVTTPKPAEATPVAASAKSESKAAATPAKKTETVTEYWVQAGSFSSRSYAENAQDAIASYKIESEIFAKEVNGRTMYRVRMGPYRTKNEADYWMTVIRSDPVFGEAYITEVKTQK